MAEALSDDEYEVRHLGQAEDLVIDGETAIDDLLVAQRIAEQEQALADAAAALEAECPRRRPSKADVEQLISLLRQTSELTARIGELPSEFDDLVGDEVRHACRAAAAAMEHVPSPEPAGSSEEEEELPPGHLRPARVVDPEAALVGLDLESTDEEEAAVAAVRCVAGSATKGSGPVSGVAAGASTAAGGGGGGKGTVKAEDREEEEDEDEAEAEGEASVGPRLAPKEEDARDSAYRELRAKMDEGAPVIATSGFPERLPADSEVQPIGEVHAYVDGLLVVRGELDSKTLDIQSVVCTEDRMILGVVIDVFGAVVEPHYLVFIHPESKVDRPDVGDRICAATSLAETSFLCDSADPEIIRQRLAMMNGAVGSSEDESGSEAGSSDEESVVNGESGLLGRMLDDVVERVNEQRAPKGKSKGKGKGKSKGKGKGKDLTAPERDRRPLLSDSPPRADARPRGSIVKEEGLDERGPLLQGQDRARWLARCRTFTKSGASGASPDGSSSMQAPPAPPPAPPRPPPAPPTAARAGGGAAAARPARSSLRSRSPRREAPSLTECKVEWSDGRGPAFGEQRRQDMPRPPPRPPPSGLLASNPFIPPAAMLPPASALAAAAALSGRGAAQTSSAAPPQRPPARRPPLTSAAARPVRLRPDSRSVDRSRSRPTSAREAPPLPSAPRPPAGRRIFGAPSTGPSAAPSAAPPRRGPTAGGTGAPVSQERRPPVPPNAPPRPGSRGGMPAAPSSAPPGGTSAAGRWPPAGRR